ARGRELAALVRAPLQRAGRPGDLVEMGHERHEQLARAGDLFAVAARLLGDGVDLPLRLLGAEVQLRRDPRRLLRILTPVADELPLALGAGRAAGRPPRSAAPRPAAPEPTPRAAAPWRRGRGPASGPDAPSPRSPRSCGSRSRPGSPARRIPGPAARR